MAQVQFTLKDLFLSTTLVALGLVIAVLSVSPVFLRVLPWIFWYLYVPLGLWLSGGAMIGAGVLFPFKKAAVGAVIGVVMQMVIFFILITDFESL